MSMSLSTWTRKNVEIDACKLRVVTRAALLKGLRAGTLPDWLVLHFPLEVHFAYTCHVIHPIHVIRLFFFIPHTNPLSQATLILQLTAQDPENRPGTAQLMSYFTTTRPGTRPDTTAGWEALLGEREREIERLQRQVAELVGVVARLGGRDGVG